MNTKTRFTRRDFMRVIAATVPATALPGGFSISAESVHSYSSGMQLELSRDGSITSANFRGIQRSISGDVQLAGCVTRGNKVIYRSGQSIAFEREIVCGMHHAHVVDWFSPIEDGVRWRVEITGEGEPWTTPIKFHVSYPVTPGVRFWTAWADPDPALNPVRLSADAGKPAAAVKIEGLVWHDPLICMPPRNRRFYYGAPPFDNANPRKGFVPSEADLFSIPVATFSESANDAGLSMALALDDTLLDLTLDTSEDGSIAFTHLFHRISTQAPVILTIDLVAHEAGWRGGLRYLVHQYPEYFDPANNQLADDLAGTAAYASSRETSFDAAKMKAMSFRTNWMSSYDFPYMGLFLPPVADDVPWPRFSKDRRGSNGSTTVQKLARYAQHMRELGFHVLNYFNVTEFGERMSELMKGANANPDSTGWENAGWYLQSHFPAAMLQKSDGSPYYSWGGAVAMNPGEPAYQRHLLDQARRQLRSFPYSDGFCIDRLDWLRFYNQKGDDHVSWFDDRATESLVISWRQLISKLAPEVHAADKVLFCNNHTKRIDLLCGIDGIYDEFGDFPTSLNTTSLLGVHRPVLGWTRNAGSLRPDPDAYFQRNLYLGVYPTAPFPGNDHSITPDPWVDQQYLDYGSLLDAMRGRRWVLTPDPIRVLSGVAIVNLFETPAGFIVPVMFGGTDKQVVVELHGVQANSAEVLHPGSSSWKPLSSATVHNGGIQITVPLFRGCAMLRLRRPDV